MSANVERAEPPPGGDRLAIAIRPAVVADVPLVLHFIRELAEYEQLADQVVATADVLRETLFGAAPKAEVVFAMVGGEALERLAAPSAPPAAAGGDGP